MTLRSFRNLTVGTLVAVFALTAGISAYAATPNHQPAAAKSVAGTHATRGKHSSLRAHKPLYRKHHKQNKAKHAKHHKALKHARHARRA